MRAPFLALTAALVLAACDGSSPEADEFSAIDTGEMPPADSAVGVVPSPPPVLDSLPATMRGRWGMTAADCDLTRDDAKGLLTITPTTLEFYESVGTLDMIEDAEPTRIRASFDFTGEGMSWQRDVTLDMQDGGETLIRQEHGEGAAAGPFRYARCN